MFIFKFEKMLKLKENMIKKCMLEIANIEAMINKSYEIKFQLEEENRKRKQLLNSMFKDKPEKNMLIFIAENISKAENEILYIKENIENLKRERKKKIEEAKMLNLEKKKLEKLKEKEYENYVKEENKAETRFLDEIANIKSANSIINS